MEIVLNKESKRKTPVAIAFRDDERTVGEDAYNIGVKYPNNMYFYLLELLGKNIDNPIVQIYKKRFPYYVLEQDKERGTVVFQHNNDLKFSPEELLAMILSKAKEYAENFAHQQISECVITVPPFFNQAERRSMLKAAELAGLKVLQLMNSNTAAALNYGIFRRKDFNETAQNILFYDMGASSTVATIASYQIVKTKDRGYAEYHPQVSVMGLGVKLLGIPDGLVKHQQNGAEFKGIKAHFVIDDSGILSLTGVESTFEKIHPAIEVQNEATNQTQGDEGNTTNANSTEKNTNTTKQETKPKIEVLKEEIKREETPLDVPDLNGVSFESAQKRIAELNEKDRVRKEKEMAQNALEAFILDTQDKLNQEEFQLLTTEDERNQILEKCNQVSDWLYEDGSDVEAKAYETKLVELKDLTGALLRHKYLSDNDINDKYEDLLVFGYACKLFRDDEKAVDIDQGKFLIPWMGDENITIDRYDVRGMLFDLKPYEVQRAGYDHTTGLTTEEKHIEQLCDEERYYALYRDESEEALIKEEEIKRLNQDLSEVTSNEVSYHQVPYSYSAWSQGHGKNQASSCVTVKSSLGALGDAIYIPPPSLSVPEGIIVPPTQKLAKIIEKTADFISAHGTQMEIIVKTKQANNPMFQFLHFDSQLHPFYRHVMNAIRSGAYAVLSEDNLESTEKLVEFQQDNVLTNIDDQSSSHYLHPSLQSKCDSVLQDLCLHEDRTASQLQQLPSDLKQLIDKTASYMARMGYDYEEVLLNKGDPRFGFLSTTHVCHSYYSQKRSLYSEMHQKAKKLKQPLTTLVPEMLAKHQSNEQEAMKRERRKKAALFLDKMRKDSLNQTSSTLSAVKKILFAAEASKSGSETSSPLPSQLLTVQPAFNKIAEGIRAKVIAMIEGDKK
nr:EOG090X07RL [Macrothrix elegans]